MPQVVGGALVAGIVGGITVSTVTAGVITYTAIGIGFSFTSFATSLVLGGLSMALAPDAPSAPRQTPKGITRQIRQPITTRKLIYGECRVSGPMVFVAESGDNQYFHLVLPLAGHECQEIGEIWLNDIPITDDMLDGNGDVTTGRFAGLVRIKKHLGGSGQTADSDLVSAITEWTSAHIGNDISYIYARYQYDRDEFPSGVPNLSAWVKGKIVSDDRVSSGWDVSTASYDSVSYDVLTENPSIGGLVFSENGDYAFTVNAAGDPEIFRYPLSTAWDVSTMGASDQSYSLTAQATVSTEFQFNDDGTKFYVLCRGTDYVYQYNLTSAYDLDTASYASKSVDISTEEGSAWGMFFKPDGTKMYISGDTSDLIYQYTLSTAWDVSTATYDTATGSVASEDNLPRAIYIKSDGTTLYMAGHTNDVIFQYTMSTPWDITTLAYASKSYDVSTEETAPQGIWFKTDGSKMYIVGQGGDSILQYSIGTTENDAWSPNMALIVNDYMKWDEYGFGALDDEVDSTYTQSAANTCEEIVTVTNDDHTVASIDTSTDLITIDADLLELHTGDQVWVSSTGSVPGGLASATNYYVIPYQRKDTPRIRLATSLDNAVAGTYINITSAGSGTITIRKNGEPRYFGGGVLDTQDTLKTNIEKMLPTMAGRAVYTDKWRILAGAYTTPTITLTEDDIVGTVTMPTGLGRADLFNTVKGLYTPPHESGLEADFPSYSNSTYITEDGETITRDLNQPFTQRPQHGRRVAKIELERARQEIVFTTDIRVKQGVKLTPGTNVYITLSKYGWSSKAFEVTNWGLVYRDDSDGGGTPVCPITFRETASTLFDWNNGEEVTQDPAPNTNLPNPFDVTVVTGFSLDAVLVSTQGADYVYNTLATWNLHTDQFVTEGGHYEVFYKKAVSSTYHSAGKVDGQTTELVITVLEPDTLYDLQIVAYNNLGVASAPTTIEDYQVGTTAITNTEDWENATEARDPDDWETDTATAEDWE